jgi:hypothetical protein
LLCCRQIDLSGKDGIVGRAKSVDRGSRRDAKINKAQAPSLLGYSAHVVQDW